MDTGELYFGKVYCGLTEEEAVKAVKEWFSHCKKQRSCRECEIEDVCKTCELKILNLSSILQKRFIV